MKHKGKAFNAATKLIGIAVILLAVVAVVLNLAGSSGQNPLGQSPLDEPELCIEKLVLWATPLTRQPLQGGGQNIWS